MSDPKDNRVFLKYMDGELARLWRLGMNAIIGWSTMRDGISVLSVPQFLLPSILPNYENVLVGSRKMNRSKLQALSNICEIEPYSIRFPICDNLKKTPWKALDTLIQRYSIIKTNDRAVILFDIVEFSHYSEAFDRQGVDRKDVARKGREPLRPQQPGAIVRFDHPENDAGSASRKGNDDDHRRRHRNPRL